MTHVTAKPDSPEVPPPVLGVFNYISASTPSSLYRNGRVLLRRDRDGNDDGIQGFEPEPHAMALVDGRGLHGAQRPTLERNGFELLARPLSRPSLDFLDQRQVLERYYPECARIVAQITGGRAYAFDHNVRVARAKQRQLRIAGGQQVQEPIHVVHGDYTLTSGPQRLRDLAQPPGGNDTLRSVLAEGQALVSEPMLAGALAEGGRFAIVNLWRNIDPQPVAMHPLAVCDGQSVAPEDLVVFELHYQNRIGENYFAKHAERHRWAWFPQMTRDEALLIKQWDSAGTLARSQGKANDSSDSQAPCTFSFHSAFDDPGTTPDAPDRQSIEVRCVVIYDTPAG
jgi:hypothetical protein